MGRKVLVSFDLDNPVDTKTVMDLITKHIGEMQHDQQKLPMNHVVGVGGEENPHVFEPSTLKQQILMDKLKIKWDNNVSKNLASKLIDEKLGKKGDG
jgi:hypothetical protein